MWGHVPGIFASRGVFMTYISIKSQENHLCLHGSLLILHAVLSLIGCVLLALLLSVH